MTIKTIASVSEIQKTTDYYKFSFLEGNRDLCEKSINKLMRSIDEEDLTRINPIVVNSDFEIIDGQHRFEALKRLNKPVYYFVLENAGIETVHRLNLYQRNWTTLDFIKCFAAIGKKDYRRLLHDIEFLKLKYAVALRILNTKTDVVKQGGLVYTEQTAKYLKSFINDYRPIVDYVDNSGTAISTDNCYYIDGMRILRLAEGFDFKIWERQVKNYGHKLVRCLDSSSSLKCFIEIYNYNRPKTNNHLDFLIVFEKYKNKERVD